jgi:hypothetical protein
MHAIGFKREEGRRKKIRNEIIRDAYLNSQSGKAEKEK